MIEVPDVFLVEEYLQVTVEATAEIRFQFRVQPGDQCSHSFVGCIVTLMSVGNEEVVGHGRISGVTGASWVMRSDSSDFPRLAILRNAEMEGSKLTFDLALSLVCVFHPYYGL